MGAGNTDLPTAGGVVKQGGETRDVLTHSLKHVDNTGVRQRRARYWNALWQRIRNVTFQVRSNRIETAKVPDKRMGH